ncbi:unnamed protein product [Bursaphelenchus okinawaensis]|uniref:Uncharacterized protein n=1 Tax=Bursaphelenchus okinawaensis TaxID=465554 RepID=A0A811KN22_9BILA|nr:unnamed protein product [Bursaphelenchus okinawaensis]CAG9105621.1 unnamed protein product [Bursaphelenchus okinawaensis]
MKNDRICWQTVNVHTAVFIMTFPLLLLTAVLIVIEVTGEDFSWIYIIAYAFDMLITLLLLIGNRLKRVVLYCPFLVLNVITIIIFMLFWLLLVVEYIMDMVVDKHKEEDRIRRTMMAIFIIFSLTVTISIRIYLEYIIIKDRSFLLGHRASSASRCEKTST